MGTDPVAEFYSAYDLAWQERDWGAQVDAAVRLTRRTALTVLRTIGVDAPPGASTVRLTLLARDAAPSHEDRFVGADAMLHVHLRELYRAIWWLRESLPEVRLSGCLSRRVPYNGLRHVMTCIGNDARMILAVCPRAPRPVPRYFALTGSSSAPTAIVPDPDEEDLENWFQASHALEDVDVDGWRQPVALLDDEADWHDVVQLPQIETDVYSERVRRAIEEVARPGDTHAWLPVTVLRGEERRQYWLPNVFGAPAADTWGLTVELAADRTVVLRGAGDGEPLFAERVRAALSGAGVASECWSEG